MRTLCSFIISCMFLCFGWLQAQDKTPTIVISTQNTALVYTTNAKKQLTQLYFGQSLTNTSDYTLKNKQSTGYYYSGFRPVREPSLGVVHSDNNPSLELQYINHNTKTEGNIQTTQIQLKDPQYPFYVTLYFKAYKMKMLLNNGQKLNIRRKRPLH